MKLESRNLSAGTRAPWLLAAAGVVLTCLVGANPDLLGIQLRLPPERQVVIWPHPLASLLAAAASVLTVVAAAVMALRHHGLAPRYPFLLALLPASFVAFFFAPFVPRAAAASLLFFLPVLLGSFALFRFAAAADARGGEAPVGRLEVLLTGVLFAVLYTAVGVHFTKSVGEHAGDEAHYLTQARSLHNDGDLDLRNDLSSLRPEQIRNQHISPNSRGGHWYSWHSFGLSLLLAPFVPGSLWARHAVLGLFSGLGCAGLMELCRALGARRIWSHVAVWLLGLGTFWGVYSSRALPEVAGAALTTWAVVAILRQRELPWGSAAICVAACGCLPWLHTRFLPVSGLCAAMYGIAGLLGREAWPGKLLRLGCFSAACLAALSGFFAVQFAMFKGGVPLPVGLILFAYPQGMWLVIASDRGLLATLPMFAGLLAAAVWILLRDPGRRAASVIALVLLAAVLAFSCATEFFEGGACLPGRYLLVVAPLFVPLLARALGGFPAAARWWILFLGLVPVFDFALLLARLPEFGKAFSSPHECIGAIYDVFAGLMHVFWRSDGPMLHPFPILLLAGTLLLPFLKPDWRLASRAVPLAMLCGSALACLGHDRRQGPRPNPAAVAHQLERAGTNLAGSRIQAWGDVSPRNLFELSDRFRGDEGGAPDVTTRDLGAAVPGGVVSQPRLEVNDWNHRDYRWVTLTKPFAARPGSHAFRLQGRVSGEADLVWAVREGTGTLVEAKLERDQAGRVEGVASLTCTGKGKVHLLVRLEGGEGRLDDVRLSWTRYSEELLKRGGWVLPKGPSP